MPEALVASTAAVELDVPRSAPELLKWASQFPSFQITAPIDVDEIARLLKIRVVDRIYPNNPDIVGQIFFTPNREPIIELNVAQNSYAPRRRFTLAHEIGHFCLHARQGEPCFVDTRERMSRKETFWDAHESQANSFAAALLMPRDLIFSEGKSIIDEFSRPDQSTGATRNISAEDFIDAMARKFNVSNVSMEYRLRNLEIIKD